MAKKIKKGGSKKLSVKRQSFLTAFKVFEKWVKGHKPTCHVVLGSGFGSALDSLCADGGRYQEKSRLSFTQVPGLPGSTVVDHAGVFRLVKDRVNGKTYLFQQGRLHGYEGHLASVAVWPVMLGRAAGIENFLLTNAAGGINRQFAPGDAMLITDIVNLSGQNPLTGENPVAPSGKPWGPRFPEMGSIFDQNWTNSLVKDLEAEKVRVHRGVYLGIGGPSFETPAEIRLFGDWKMDAVGMSTVWESIALKHSGARIAGLSLISNMACGIIKGEKLEHESIVKTCRDSAEAIVRGILRWSASL